MSKVKLDVKDGAFSVGVDLNEDGQNLVSLKVNLSEALQELISRGDAKDGVKLVDFKFEGAVLKLRLDTDKDGEELLELALDLTEALDEVSGALK